MRRVAKTQREIAGLAEQDDEIRLFQHFGKRARDSDH